MDRTEIDEMLARTLDDGRVSRGERKALKEAFRDAGADPRMLAEVRSRAFDAARAEMGDSRGREIVDWLEEVVKVVWSLANEGAVEMLCEAAFSPGEACRNRIVGLIGGARASIDAAVYTVTDDRISRALAEAHRRGVAVRLLTDNEKAGDLGSDVARLEQQGVAVATDASEFQMHHKFALFDERTLLTGSYNWTRTAAEHNQENLVVSDDPRLVGAFREEFGKLWRRFKGA